MLIARRIVNVAVEDSGGLAHFVGEGDEVLRQKRLHAVGERFVRLVMNFDKKAIRADGYSSARKRQDFVAFAGTVAGINEDWKMAALFYGGENSGVGWGAWKIGGRSKAAAATPHGVISLREHV